MVIFLPFGARGGRGTMPRPCPLRDLASKDYLRSRSVATIPVLAFLHFKPMMQDYVYSVCIPLLRKGH